MTVAPQPGDVLAGKFRVEWILGEGGMGLVVAATHIGLGQLVALKLMRPQGLGELESVARFEREARAAVRLRSEHVARVSDVGRLESGAPYMVMEFLEGEDLNRVVERDGALPIETAVDYTLQACEAVAEAHSLGIVHRDLKPQNLFLTRSVTGKPLVKVLDFGISKVAGVAENMSLTSTTQVLGSPNYMSPEQLRALRDVDHRSDVWALGTILYELVTGRVPFKAETITQLAAMVVADPPQRPTELRGEIPPRLEAVILRCLEKRRDDRFQSITDLAEALAPFASSAGASKARDVMATTGDRGADHPRRPVPPPSDSGSVRVAAGARTDVSWDQTQVAPRDKLGTVTRIGLAALGTVAIGGVALWLLRAAPGPAATVPHDAESPAVAPVTAVPAAAEPTAPATASPAGAGEPIPPPAASAIDAVTSRPTSAPAARPRKPTPAVVKPSAAPSAPKPKPTANTSDLPDVRD